jgi:hypothetical protein
MDFILQNDRTQSSLVTTMHNVGQKYENASSSDTNKKPAIIKMLLGYIFNVRVFYCKAEKV